MRKQQDLLRDLAKLFVKYDLSDWSVVIETLRKGGQEYEDLIHAIEDLSTRRPSKKKVTQSPRIARLIKDLERRNPERAKILSRLFGQLKNKAIAPRLADLRETCLQLGIKEKVPGKREEAIAFLLKHLIAMPDDFLFRALGKMPAKNRNLQDEYDRWFKMISES